MTTAALLDPQDKRLWTYDEMIAELPGTNLPVELWNGEIIMSPAPHPDHQRIVKKLCEKLDRFVGAQQAGEVFLSPLDVVLTQHRVVQPDLIFIAKERMDIVRDCIRGVPDLAIEVISENSWQRDRINKKALYEQFGMPEYWIVDPESGTIEVFVLEKGSYQLHSKGAGASVVRSKLLPRFEVSFDELKGR